MSSGIAIVVPARLQSQRFPRKLLHAVLGKPVILWTAERIRSEAPEFPLVFAVAEAELADVLGESGFATVMTDPDLPSGTDRIAAVASEVEADAFINIQADEPLVHREHITALAGLIGAGDAAMATLAVPFQTANDFCDPSKVKVVRAANGEALYFSRSPIPFDRDTGGAPPDAWFTDGPAFWHLGLYAYTRPFLEVFSQLPPGKLEHCEKLEQLRVLEAGHRIKVGIVNRRTVGIDTREDVSRLEGLLREKRSDRPGKRSVQNK